MKVVEYYKNKHKGEDFVIFGSGPSLLKWENEYLDAVKIGCNGVFFHKEDLDYHFVQDSGRVNNNETCYLKNQEAYNSYEPAIAKFYGRIYLNNMLTPQSMVQGFCDASGAIPYIMSLDKKNYYSLNALPICEWGNVIFSCIQFAMFAGAKRIVIVGCDISNNIRLGETEEHNAYVESNLIPTWEHFVSLFDQFCSNENRDSSIECFNPIGLKGILGEFKPNSILCKN